jgi:hypothetical protein
MSVTPFRPSGVTVNTAVTTSSSTPVKICDQMGAYQIRLYNSGTAVTFVAWGGPNVTASPSSGYPVGPGVIEVITVESPYNSPVYFAAISTASNANLYVTPGQGI